MVSSISIKLSYFLLQVLSISQLISQQVLSYTCQVVFRINDIVGERSLVHEAERQPPHKIDENMWKNREQIEEILFLLERCNWPNAVRLKDLKYYNVYYICICKMYHETIRFPFICLCSFRFCSLDLFEWFCNTNLMNHS